MSIMNAFRVDGKTALVTGCRRGIGRGFAQALADAGADIVGGSASLEAEGSEVERDVVGRGRTFRPYSCDFSDRAAVYDFIRRVDDEVGTIDILVSNAGTIRREPAAQHKDEDWDLVLEVNLSSHFVLAREFGRRMIDRGYGKIVFTASLLSYQGGITVPGYAASKGGINTLAMALANEWAGGGVNVNAIAPGYIATDNTEALQSDPARAEQLMARVPAGRWGTPDDLKGAVVYLCSPASDFVNGINLVVDGGWMGR